MIAGRKDCLSMSLAG